MVAAWIAVSADAETAAIFTKVSGPSSVNSCVHARSSCPVRARCPGRPAGGAGTSTLSSCSGGADAAVVERFARRAGDAQRHVDEVGGRLCVAVDAGQLGRRSAPRRFARPVPGGHFVA